MSTLVDIPEEDLTLLNKLVKRSGSSRAQLVRQAISAYFSRTNSRSRYRPSVYGPTSR